MPTQQPTPSPSRFHVLERVMNLFAQTIVVVGAISVLMGWISEFSLADWLFSGSQFEERLEAVETRPVRSFGDYERRNIDWSHHAETDGLVAVYSGGASAAPFLLRAGATQEQDQMQIITKGLAYEGATLPVKRGNWYRIDPGPQWRRHWGVEHHTRLLDSTGIARQCDSDDDCDPCSCRANRIPATMAGSRSPSPVYRTSVDDFVTCRQRSTAWRYALSMSSRRSSTSFRLRSRSLPFMSTAWSSVSRHALVQESTPARGDGVGRHPAHPVG